MKKILAVVLGLIFSLAASQAMAFSLAGGYTGPIKVKFSNYEMPSLPFALGEGQANGTEDLWGILKVTTILSDDGNDTILWSAGPTEELTGMFYDLDLNAARMIGPLVEVDFVGGLLDIYLDATPDFTAVGGPGVRCGLGCYPTVTDGGLFLSMVFTPGVHGDGTTLHGLIDSMTLPITGHGSGFLAITGGSHQYMFGPSAHQQNDVCTPGAPGCIPVGYGWPLKSEDPMRMTAVVPEPSTILLLGAGLAGLGLWARRKVG